MGRNPRRVLYASLREQAIDSALPFDEACERGAIGAVLLAPHEHAKRLSRRLFKDHFHFEPHGWLWARMSYAIGQQKVRWSDNIEVYRWLKREKIAESCRRKYGLGITEVVEPCLEYFWWHGDWYCDRVMAAAKCRARVMKASGDLEEALIRAETGWVKGRW